MGPVYILGTIAGFSFYKSGEDYLVRRKGGPSKKQVLKSAAFERSRENFSEFGRCSKAGKFLRAQLGSLLTVSDSFAYQRMTQLMNRIKNLDAESPRGERKVSTGLKSAKGKKLLYQFAFNGESPLQTTMSKMPYINSKQEILIQKKELVFPAGATHALISAARLNLNFENEEGGSAAYTEQCVCLKDKDQTLKLKAKQTEVKEGHVAYFLQVKFYTMQNGSLVPFMNGRKDSLACIALDPELPEEIKKPAMKGIVLPFRIKHFQRVKRVLANEKIISPLMDAPG